MASTWFGWQAKPWLEQPGDLVIPSTYRPSVPMLESEKLLQLQGHNLTLDGGGGLPMWGQRDGHNPDSKGPTINFYVLLVLPEVIQQLTQ